MVAEANAHQNLARDDQPPGCEILRPMADATIAMRGPVVPVGTVDPRAHPFESRSSRFGQTLRENSVAACIGPEFFQRHAGLASRTAGHRGASALSRPLAGNPRWVAAIAPRRAPASHK